jgi:hypothetical protein
VYHILLSSKYICINLFQKMQRHACTNRDTMNAKQKCEVLNYL